MSEMLAGVPLAVRVRAARVVVASLADADQRKLVLAVALWPGDAELDDGLELPPPRRRGGYTRPTYEPRTCAECGALFMPTSPSHRYCCGGRTGRRARRARRV